MRVIEHIVDENGKTIFAHVELEIIQGEVDAEEDGEYLLPPDVYVIAQGKR